MENNNINISVIIPLHTHEHLLEKCLFALKKQTYKNFEVIVVYNGKGLNSKEIVENFGFRWVNEEKVGSYSARNTGIKIAKSSIIAFTDADCIPKENWIEEAIKIFEKKKDIDIIGGKIELIYKNNKPKTYEIFENIFDFNQKYFIEQNHSGCTSNLFVKKGVFEKIGLFDENFKSMGDYKFTRKAHKEGINLSYIENIVIFHPTRKNFWKFIKKQQRLAGGIYLLLKDESFNFFDLFIKITISNIMNTHRFIKISIKENLSLIKKIKIIILIVLIHKIIFLESIMIFLGKNIKYK